MRIAYGVHGYGKGHAARSLAALTELAKRHTVHVWCGGDAWDLLRDEVPATRIDSLGFSYDAQNRRSNWHSFWDNLPLGQDMLLRGERSREIERQLAHYAPDVVISDAEPFLHRSARQLGIPRIGFDHFGVMTFCRPPLSGLDPVRIAFDRWLYRTFLGRPDRVLISSFFEAPPRYPGVEVVPPLMRDEVHALEAHVGQHLLVYLNNGDRQLTTTLQLALRDAGLPVRLYGSSRRGTHGNIEFLAPANQGFLEDLASCRAVLSTAGNQLVGEALHFGKPMLVMPEKCVEQRMNATGLVQLGIGEAHDGSEVTATVIRRFLGRHAQYAEQARLHQRDGRAEAIAILERWMTELVAQRRSRSAELAA